MIYTRYSALVHVRVCAACAIYACAARSASARWSEEMAEGIMMFLLHLNIVIVICVCVVSISSLCEGELNFN